MISAIAMTVMLVVALGCFSWLIIPRLKLVLRAPGEQRFDDPVERSKSVLKFAIGQWRMPREPIAGLAHIFTFSGFMVVALGTILHRARLCAQGSGRVLSRDHGRQMLRVY